MMAGVKLERFCSSNELIMKSEKKEYFFVIYCTN